MGEITQEEIDYLVSKEEQENLTEEFRWHFPTTWEDAIEVHQDVSGRTYWTTGLLKLLNEYPTRP